MTVWFHWRFWVALSGTICTLAGIGLGIANQLVEPPPEYFRASYFEFGLPTGWSANREGDEVVCTSSDQHPTDAIIILAAKDRSSDDNLDDYLEFLKQPRHQETPDGMEFESEVVYARKVAIGEYDWVDALHFESEVPGFYTRYMATTTSHLGLVVTFTAAKDAYEARNTEFERSIESLDIYQSPSPFN